MRRVDIALIAVTLVLGAIWYYLRQADVPEPAGSVTARATTAARPRGRVTPTPPVRGSQAGGPRASGEPFLEGLRVEADVPDADVFVDRVYKGKAPLALADVAPGSHRINVSAEGYDGYAETVEVTGADQLVSVRFKQVRLAAALDVVHKHGIGSCRGRLSATPAGLRYAPE
ncbi:MAG TPA: PEGA domain-containing protein, partial [Vicinamibacteria bacterium]|nr:PEGA domain-containing protein [Vicinamibacteria bacterium]